MAETTEDLINPTVQVVSAFLAQNRINAEELPALIERVHQSLSGLGASPSPAAEPQPDKPTPAQIRRSITPDHLVSFVDGRSFKSLKRHLSVQGMTPAQYRERFGLPSDYPMVAANYAAQRSALAKSIGLGAKGRKPQSTTSKPASKRGGGRSKAPEA